MSALMEYLADSGVDASETKGPLDHLMLLASYCVEHEDSGQKPASPLLRLIVACYNEGFYLHNATYASCKGESAWFHELADAATAEIEKLTAQIHEMIPAGPTQN